MIQRLIKEFQRLHSRVKPDWAWNFPPSIPLIGQDFRVGDGLFVYASAENLSWHNTGTLPPQFQRPKAWNRYREVFESRGRHEPSFFPELGIAPLSKGPLMCAGHYLAEACDLPISEKPRDFLEHIAASNFCKFSVKSRLNKDYINDVNKVRESLPFVVAELSLLRPAVILLPESVWKYREPADAIRSASPKSKVVACKQFNSTVVNTQLGHLHELGQRLRNEHRGQDLRTWMDNCHGLNHQNSWRFIAHLQIAMGN